MINFSFLIIDLLLFGLTKHSQSDNLRIQKTFFGLSEGNLRLFAPIRDNPECQNENRTCKMFEQIRKPGNTASWSIDTI